MNHFTCDRCAYCCKNFDIRLKLFDILRIRLLGYKNFIRKKDNKTYLKKTKQGCIFLNKNNCKIYKSRPFICKTYPSKKKTVLYCDGKIERVFNAKKL